MECANRTFRVDSRAESTDICQVHAQETWTIAVAGRWKDWWIPCGPEGYRFFMADVLGIRPRFAGAPWFALVGQVEDEEPFPIGRTTTRTFARSGMLRVWANDRPGWYGNNRGSLDVTLAPGGYTPGSDPAEWHGLLGQWRHLRETIRRTQGVGFIAALVLIPTAGLAFLPQGRDLLRTVAEYDKFRGQQFSFLVTLLFLALQAWFWSRAIVQSNYGRDRDKWRPRFLLTWAPRLLGLAPFVMVGLALLRTPSPGSSLVLAQIVAAALFFLFVIFRCRLLDAVPRAAAWHWQAAWVTFGLVLAAVSMVVATADPVWFGDLLGAPGVVFLGLACIIPPMVLLIQTGAGMRIPVVLLLAAAAVLMSWWVDNHAVGSRGFGNSVRQPWTERRLGLADAYAEWRGAWNRAHTGGAADPIMVVAVSEGGASRAGFWTAEVLARLHQKSRGRLADSLFAIVSVSGGSVGSIGYAGALRAVPDRNAARITNIARGVAGRDVLSPAMAGMLFPDLAQRFLPIAFLPDRAAALERGWERAWQEHCPEEDCRGLMRQPFLSLAPERGSWRPILIVQGASEETGRRVLTSGVRLPREFVDADDFHATSGFDVPLSTAVTNGARFPWISPAGSIRDSSGESMRIVDGGYFDAAGAATAVELVRAIRHVAQDPDLKIVVLFIGYTSSMEEQQPEDEPSIGAGSLRNWAPRSPISATVATEPLPRAATTGGPVLLNDLLAPLHALWTSRLANAAHLMRAARHDPAGADWWIPILLCRRPAPDAFEPPMDWALSREAMGFMGEATGLSGRNPCRRSVWPPRNRTAIEGVAALVTRR